MKLIFASYSLQPAQGRWVFLMRANGEASSSGFVLASTKGLTSIGQLFRFRYSWQSWVPNAPQSQNKKKCWWQRLLVQKPAFIYRGWLVANVRALMDWARRSILFLWEGHSCSARLSNNVFQLWYDPLTRMRGHGVKCEQVTVMAAGWEV